MKLASVTAMVSPMANEVLQGTMDKRLHHMLQAMLTMTVFNLIWYLFLLFLYAMSPTRGTRLIADFTRRL